MLHIKGLLNIKVECDNCDFDACANGVEINSNSLHCLDEQIEFYFKDWSKISGQKEPEFIWVCPNCAKPVEDSQAEWMGKFEEMFGCKFVDVTDQINKES